MSAWRNFEQVMSEIRITAADKEDWLWVDENSSSVGGPEVVSCGTLYMLRDHEGFIAWQGPQRVGFATLRSNELLAIAVTVQWSSIGTHLLEHCERLIRDRGYPEIWLVTTNDNLDAMRFYQRRGYVFDTLHAGGFDEVKRLKQIEGDVLGNFGITIRDEILFKNAQV